MSIKALWWLDREWPRIYRCHGYDMDKDKPHPVGAALLTSQQLFPRRFQMANTQQSGSQQGQQDKQGGQQSGQQQQGQQGKQTPQQEKSGQQGGSGQKNK